MKNPENQKWIPGADGILSSSDTGVLHRFWKMARTFEPIPLVDPYQRVTLHDTSYPYAYLVARAFLGTPPALGNRKTLQRVIFADGNRLNSHPSNLYWEPTKQEIRDQLSKARDAVARQLTETDSLGEFRQLVAAPNVFLKSDGTMWKLSKNGDLKQCFGHLAGPLGVRVSLCPHFERGHLLKEIMADVYLPPRPTKLHRAYCADGNPRNTHPDNLRWRFDPNARPYMHTWEYIKASRHYECQRDEIKQAALEQFDILKDQGAKRLRNNPNLWAHPGGTVYRVDLDTGQLIPLEIKDNRFHIPGGFLDEQNKLIRTTHGINALDFLCDAFASDPRFPNLADLRRGTYQTTYPVDGDWSNRHPSNIAISDTSTRQKRRHFYFDNQ